MATPSTIYGGREMKKAKRVVWWLTVNFGLLILAGLGLWYDDYGWALNLSLFFLWAMAVLRFLAVYVPSLKAEAIKVGRIVPQFLSVSVDLALTVMLASSGRFVIAAVWFYQLGCEEYIYLEAAKLCQSK
jgi:hypothetical protein